MLFDAPNTLVTFEPMSRENKVVWITGASSGIGEALCKEYAQNGYKVILSSRREEELERVGKSLPQDQFRILPYDVTDFDGVQSKVDKAISFFGQVDIIVLNAGISQRSTVSETSLDVDRKIMEVNYFGQVALAKGLLKHFKENEVGHYVVISSLTGKFGFFLRSAYGASKHALHGFFEALRLEEEDQGVRVTMVCPTLIKTNISKSAVDGEGKSFGKMDPLQENGISPEECARQIYRAQQVEKLEIIVGKKKVSVLLKRLFPSFFHRLIRKQRPDIMKK